MQIKNWKTTLAGAITAVALVVFQLWTKGTLDAKTVIEALGIAIGMYLANDANIDQTIKDSPLAAQLLAALDRFSGELSTSQPANTLLMDVHNILNKLDENVKALPAAVAASIPAPSVVVDASTNTNAAPPVIEKPAQPLFNRFSGKPLTEDPETVTA